MALVSTIIYTLQFTAVSIALIYQAHQTKIAQMIGSRGLHVEMMRFMVGHPALNFEEVTHQADATQEVLNGMSLWMAYWNTMWHIRKIDEKALRFMTSQMFSRRAAREWW